MRFSLQDNRVGMFHVKHEAHDEAFAALLTICHVLHSERHPSNRGITYIAASKLFDPLASGDEIPEYRIECAHDAAFEQADHQARRVDAGRFGFVAIRQIIVRAPRIALGVVTRH